MNKPLDDSIAVGALCSPVQGLEYKGVDTKSKVTIFRQSLEAGNTDLGNFLAIVHSLRLLKRNNLEVEIIYSKSAAAVEWVNNKKCGDFPILRKKREKLIEAVKEAESWLAANHFKTQILLWDGDGWGEIDETVFPKVKN